MTLERDSEKTIFEKEYIDMASFNKVILMGRLTATPELKQTQGGAAVTNFTIAVDRRFSKEGEERKTDFPTVIAWKALAEFICKYFDKGSAILIEGELQTRSWTDNQGNKRYATEVVAERAQFCEAKKNSETNSPSQNQNAVQGRNMGSGWGAPIAGGQPNFAEVRDDEDLPF